jgi:hypothetical protein
MCGMEEGKKRRVYEEYISPSMEEEVKICFWGNI